MCTSENTIIWHVLTHFINLNLRNLNKPEYEFELFLTIVIKDLPEILINLCVFSIWLWSSWHGNFIFRRTDKNQRKNHHASSQHFSSLSCHLLADGHPRTGAPACLDRDSLLLYVCGGGGGECDHSSCGEGRAKPPRAYVPLFVHALSH